MKRFIEAGCFIFGCVASVAALFWYFAVLAGHLSFPNNGPLMWSIVVIFATAAILTFQKRPMRDPWKPVLAITPERIRISRVLLGVTASNFGLSSLLTFIERGRPEVLKCLAMSLTSLLLFYCVYIAVHWAFRPQSLFAPAILDFFSNPLLYLIDPDRRSRSFGRKR